jgi:hypothetical protein
LLALPDIIISDQDARAAPRSGDYVDEIIADALACFDPGAANVHHHIADFNLSGREAAEVYLSLWRRVRRIHV